MKILSNALRHVGTLYGVTGGQVSTDELDLSSVQLVSDVTRLAAVGRAPGLNDGRALYQQLNAHTAAGNVNTSQNFYSGFVGSTAGWPDPVEAFIDLWLTGVWASVTDDKTDFTDMSVVVTYPAGILSVFGSAATLADRQILSATGVAPTHGAAPFMVINDLGVVVPMPVWLPRGSSFTVNSKSGGVNAFDVITIIEVMGLARGVPPSL